MSYPTYDPAPFIPGIERRRYQWLPPGDADVAKLHSSMQEGGPGMYLVYDPHRGQRVLIEAYEPWELPVQYREPVVGFTETENGGTEKFVLSRMLNPYQYADLRAGRLVCVNEIAAFSGRLTWELILRLRRGNRAAQSRYKYGHTPASYRAAEMRQKIVDKRYEESDKAIHKASEQIGDYFAESLTPKVAVPEAVTA